MKQIKYMVPARGGSQRFPGKNRVLLPYLWSALPKEILPNVVLSTDDEKLMDEVPDAVVKLARPKELCSNTASVKDVMLHAVASMGLDQSDYLVTLYPTYVDRTWGEIQEIVRWGVEHDYCNVLCADPLGDVIVHKCFFKLAGWKGRPVVEHDLYRCQDYPEAFEASCFVVLSEVGHIPELNGLLWSPNTVFYAMDRRRPDIDTLEEYRNWVAGL